MEQTVVMRGWSLLKVAAAADVPRGVARSAVRRGLLPASGWNATDAVVLRALTAIGGFPTAGDRDARDTMVAITVRGLISQNTPNGDAFVLVTYTGVFPCVSAAALETRIAGFQGSPVVVLPVGRWAHEIGEHG